MSLSSHFVTLTYDTKYIPITERGFMTLNKRDVQLFMKRLRKLQTTKLRYYAVGEYGTKTMRPHYHIILFNLENEQHIPTAWTSGGVHIGTVSGASIGYTCKYIAKPGRIPLHRNDDRVKEFSLISRGIGKGYLSDDVVKYHKSDVTRNFVTLPGGVKNALPRYYRDRIYDDDDKAIQRVVIQQSKHDEQQQHREDFYQIYGVDADYDAYCQSEKMGRYNRYYNNQQNRPL